MVKYYTFGILIKLIIKNSSLFQQIVYQFNGKNKDTLWFQLLDTVKEVKTSEVGQSKFTILMRVQTFHVSLFCLSLGILVYQQTHTHQLTLKSLYEEYPYWKECKEKDWERTEAPVLGVIRARVLGGGNKKGISKKRKKKKKGRNN